jgi:hypothetical protein
MTAEVLLSRLDKVRKTGPDRWLARCPAHADKTASLSIRELPDGRTLAHCFAGCGVDAVLAAANLEITDLFPELPPDSHHLPERRPFPASDVLKALYGETLVVQVAAHAMRRAPLGDADLARLDQAAERIAAALTLTEGGLRHGR